MKSNTDIADSSLCSLAKGATEHQLAITERYSWHKQDIARVHSNVLQFRVKTTLFFLWHSMDGGSTCTNITFCHAVLACWHLTGIHLPASRSGRSRYKYTIRHLEFLFLNHIPSLPLYFHKKKTEKRKPCAFLVQDKGILYHTKTPAIICRPPRAEDSRRKRITTHHFNRLSWLVFVLLGVQRPVT